MNILEYVPVKTYQYHAFLNSIIINHKNYIDWFANNYIQLVFFEDLNLDIKLDYLSENIMSACPLLNRVIARNKNLFLDDIDNLNNIIINSISRGECINLFVDEYYVPNRTFYKSKHNIHDILIYDVDLSSNFFSILGYSTNAHYQKSLISIDEMKLAMNNTNPCFNTFAIMPCDYKFDIQIFKIMVKEYLYSIDSRENLGIYLDLGAYNKYFFEEKINPSCVFGLSIYEKVIEKLQICSNSYSFIDYRMAYLIYEHKINLKEKIYYLQKNGYINDIEEIINGLDEMIQISNICHRVIIKYNFSKQKEIIHSVIEKYEFIKAKDKNVFEILLQKLKKY